MDELWEGALKQLREKLGNQNFETWIKPIRVREWAGSEVGLEVPNKFFRDWLLEHFLTPIQEVLSDLSHQSVKVSVSINQQLQPSGAAQKRTEQEKHKPSNSRGSNLIPKYNFENFVVGASNQFAHAASLAVANQPGDHYNPLFIYGGVGLGKTHLINAIGHRIVDKRPGLKVFYLSSESFMNELIGSLRRDKMVRSCCRPDT